MEWTNINRKALTNGASYFEPIRADYGIQMRIAWSRLTFAGALMGAMTACAPTPPPAPHYAPVAESAAPLDTNPSDIATLNRISWGAGTSSAQMLAAEGLDRYLQSQLHPSPDDGLPKDAQIEIAAMDISQKTLPQINADVEALRDSKRLVRGTPDYQAAEK